MYPPSLALGDERDNIVRMCHRLHEKLFICYESTLMLHRMLLISLSVNANQDARIVTTKIISVKVPETWIVIRQ